MIVKEADQKKRQRPVRRPIKSCIVTVDLLGRGIATETSAAIAGIAQKFASVGDFVTLLWAPRPEDVPDKAEIKRLREYYFEKFLINLELLPDSTDLLPGIGTWEKQSLTVYHYIRQQTFDAVYFVLEGGIGFYTLLGRETGVFQDTPRLYVVAQSPIAWTSEADKLFLQNGQQVSSAHMEQYCTEVCDGLICSSQEVVTWMKKKNWALPKSVEVILPVRPHEWRIPGKGRSQIVSRRMVSELIFIAGPDYHKGLTLFCDALDEIGRAHV